MTSVTHTLAADAAVIAANLNTNFADAVSLATAVGVEQLSGGITRGKLADNQAPSFTTIPLVPISAGADLASPTPFTIPTSMTAILRWRPVLKDGEEGFLCGISANCAAVAIDVATWPLLEVYLNGSVKIASMRIDLDFTDDTFISIQNDPIANPLCSMSDGDFLEFRLGPSTGSDNPQIRGLNAVLTMKYNLVA